MLKNVYIENGLLHFTELKKDDLQIVTTYDNSVWGNMSLAFAESESEKKTIIEKEAKFQKTLGTKVFVNFTTPQEDTIIDLDDRSLQYLNFIEKENEFGIKNISVRANSGIIYPSSIQNSYCFATRDCAIFFFVPPEREFVLAMHLGAIQVAQKLHTKTFRLANDLIKRSNFRNSKVYITPYISGENYYVSNEKFSIYKYMLGDDIKNYVKIKYNPIYQSEKYYFNFVDFVKRDINDQFGITDFIETGICTYESTQNGFLYSYKYVQEVQKRKEKGEILDVKKYLGTNYVVIKI